MSRGASGKVTSARNEVVCPAMDDEAQEASMLLALATPPVAPKRRIAERPASGAAKRRPRLEYWTLNTDNSQNLAIRQPIRGRWLQESHTKLRNAAWFVRNARMTGQDENTMLAQLCFEVRRVLDNGEPLESVVPSLVDLFMKP